MQAMPRHGGVAQLPLQNGNGPMHLLPHTPQFKMSLCTFTHVVPQHVSPAVQGGEHAPPSLGPPPLPPLPAGPPPEPDIPPPAPDLPPTAAPAEPADAPPLPEPP
jgi:hypothetical protein